MKSVAFFLLGLTTLYAQTEIGKTYTVQVPGTFVTPQGFFNLYLTYRVNRVSKNVKNFQYYVTLCPSPTVGYDFINDVGVLVARGPCDDLIPGDQAFSVRE
jgi:hypothetical protein